MSDTQYVPNISANLKNAIKWISEIVHKHPGKKRNEIIREAELRFDLNPRECEFLNNNFSDLSSRGVT